MMSIIARIVNQNFPSCASSQVQVWGGGAGTVDHAGPSGISTFDDAAPPDPFAEPFERGEDIIMKIRMGGFHHPARAGSSGADRRLRRSRRDGRGRDGGR